MLAIHQEGEQKHSAVARVSIFLPVPVCLYLLNNCIKAHPRRLDEDSIYIIPVLCDLYLGYFQ